MKAIFMVIKLMFHLYDTFSDHIVLFSWPMVLPGSISSLKLCFNTNVNLYLSMLDRKEVV